MEFSSTRFVILIAIVNGLLYHQPLWIFALSKLDIDSMFAIRVLVQLFFIVFTISAVFLYLVSLLSTRVMKFVCVVTFISNSLALYFLSTYGVILDKSMMGNVLNTRVEESVEFYSTELLLYLCVLGITPALLLWKVRILPVSCLRTISQALTTLFICLMIIYVNSGVVLWFDQHSRRLGGLILPWSYAINSARSINDSNLLPADRALLPAPDFVEDKRNLVVLVIGETARADNFKAYGYKRNTTPLLTNTTAQFLANVTACATYTTASIKCMFSSSDTSNTNYEPLPTYLQRNNVEVIWRSNNWGEPVMDLFNYKQAAQLRSQCQGTHCDYDGVLLEGLSSRIAESKSDKILLVLHTKGSHGPAYYKRYPEVLEKYKPVCKSVDLSTCSDAALINAYDNTLVYTDYFLDQIINMLKEIQDRTTVMMYISDHGESLGEFGFYLHGAPKLIAPNFQLRIPFIVWMSEEFKRFKDIDESDLFRDQYGHENIFHSVLGGLGIVNSLYDDRLDIFSGDR